MPKTAKTPASVLQSFIDEYQINAFSLSKNIHLSYQTVLNILKGKGKISVPTALRLGKYFSQSPEFWLNIQIASDIDKLTQNKKFVSMINSIPRAQKNTGKTKTTAKTKPARRKTKTLSEKRKSAAKAAGNRRKKNKLKGK
ncbi:MAG: HigA family addiction module antidote protein [Treponema sp.]|jgi:addiction module HigA family antidote|nr:HigA family addiction module antidote protein [Treponema sp.]